MRAPDFWRRDGLAARLLSPAAWLYDAAGRLRRRLVRSHIAGIPVLCVGNLTAGGSGKTPTALALARLLLQRGARVHFLTRGYGGRLSGPVQVDPARHDSRDVGDEALLLAALAPTWVSHDRVAGARAAAAAGADLIVMDDGFQNPSLRKDLALLVIDGEAGFGNGRVHPAGPLRERPERAWKRADGAIVVTVGSDIRDDLALPSTLPRVHARLLPAGGAQALHGRKALAFAGIGRPARFFHTVQDAGLELVAAHAFPDHHRYREDEVMALIEEANAAGAIAVTTAKDAVRLPPAARAMVTVIEAELAFADVARVEHWLDRIWPRRP